MTSCTIREIGAADWPQVDEIQHEAFSAEACEDIATIRTLAELSPPTCLLALEGVDALGYLIAHPWIADDLPPLNTHLSALPPGATTFFIHDLALRPRARGRGLAPALVQAALERGRAAGCRDASLLSIQNSRGFWEKMGFRTRPDLEEKVRPVLERFLHTEFAFMTREGLGD